MAKNYLPNTKDWKRLSHNDWGEILELAELKAFQRKFQIAEAFTALVARKGYHQTRHADIAKACKVTRQLIDHHFPSDRSILALTYKYIYARFQKYASDSLMSHEMVMDRFRAYVKSIPRWIAEHRNDARFLTQYYAISPVYPELFDLHERNTRIGQERIQVLLVGLRDEKLVKPKSDEVLMTYASSVQQQIIGHIVLYSGSKILSEREMEQKSQELWRSCFEIVSG